MTTESEGPGPEGPLEAQELFPGSRPLVGVIHLPPLPGAPGWIPGSHSMADVSETAVREARVLEEGGLGGLLVENYGDAPFFPERVPPETVAAMALAVRSVVEAVNLPVGVNVLRNDARSAVALAAVAGARFVRVNVHTGAMFTDQGLLEGRAHETLRTREALRTPLTLFADVLVKHATPPPGVTLGQAARDLRYRGKADALVVSGTGTGEPPTPDELREVKQAAPEVGVWLGSGLTPETAPALLSEADGAIVGSYLREEGRAGSPLDPERVAALVEAAARVPTSSTPSRPGP